MTHYDDKTMEEILEMDKLEYVEAAPLRPDELKDPHRIIKIELLGIIAAYQDPVRSDRIFQDFEEMNGYPLDPGAYGFKSFTSMMRTFTDKFVCHEIGMKFMYSAKKTERSGHLQELIENQVSIEEKRRRDQRRSRSYSRGRKSSYGAGIFYAQNFVPLLTDERTLEERTADNLASFGRSLAAQDVRAQLNWGLRKSRLEASSEDSSDSDGGGAPTVRSKSVPAPRAMLNEARAPIVFDDPRYADDDLEDCTNPFSVQNNVRIRDLVMKLGEQDDTGRKGMAVVEVALSFKKEYRLPLGGVPNLSEERLMTRMSAIETKEWAVETMGDGHAYVIIPTDTIKRAHEVGPGTPSTAPSSAEKPKSTGVSPAAKRMFGFALKEAINNNTRQAGTREKVVLERKASLTSPITSPTPYGADSDGDPVMMMESPEKQQEQQPPRGGRGGGGGGERAGPTFSREDMLALNDHDELDRRVEVVAASLRLLRKQTPPMSARVSPASSSSVSSVCSVRGRPPQQQPNGSLSRVAPPQSSSSMWASRSPASDKPSSSSAAGFGGGGGGATPSFGTFRSAPTPVPAAAAAASSDVDSDESSDIIQPSASNLASKLPQMSFGGSSLLKPAAPSFSAAPAATNNFKPMFGTSSQAVPSPPAAPTPAPALAPSPTPRSSAPTFGTIASSSSPAQATFPSSFGASMTSTTTSGDSTPPPKKMVEVIEEKKKLTGQELLGETIQFIGNLRAGVTSVLRDIEGTQLEDVITNNLDFFDVDEDEHIHLVHREFNPKLLLVHGQSFEELIKEETKKEETPIITDNRGTFSRPPSFARAAIPTFGGNKPRELPTFGASRPVKVADEEERPASVMSTRVEECEPAKPLAGMPSFGTTSRKMVEVIEEKQPEPAKPAAASFNSAPVERPPSVVSVASSYESATSRAGSGPSFGTKSLELQRPDSALSTRAEETRKVPSFAAASRAMERPESMMSDRSEATQQSKLYSSASSTISSSNGETALSMASIRSSLETLEMDEKEKAEEMNKTIVREKEEHLVGPFAFPTHKDIGRLCQKPSLAFDTVRNGELLLGSILGSFHPNRLVLTLLEGNMMDRLEHLMAELRTAYVDHSPLDDSVALGQFAVAINGDCIVRVVVLKENSPNHFECACLDINAIINVDGGNLYELIDKFGVHAVRSSTFVARIYGVPELTTMGHKAVKLIAKSDESDENMKKMQPIVFHGKDTESGDLVVDVAAVIANECVWLGEQLPIIANIRRNRGDTKMNPDIQNAIEFAMARKLDGYKKSGKEAKIETKQVEESDDEEDTRTLRSDSVEKMQERVPASSHISPSKKQSSRDEEEKEEGELDSSLGSAASERTIMDRHAAGDFVRDVKEEEIMDEFVIAAADATKSIIDVQSITKIIKHLNEKGENVEADVIKSICRALILSVNKNLAYAGDQRGVLIANAEALEEIDMA